MNILEVKNLHVSVDGKEILKGISFAIAEGETVALMGPNGSGKSTLAYAIMGHPRYVIEDGEIFYLGKNITSMKPDERSRLGIFLSFQHPKTIPGVSVSNFLRMAVNARRTEETRLSVMHFREKLDIELSHLKMDSSFVERYLNEGFSGGEKKRMEILQLAMLEPRLAVLDETDSGLDIDALRIVAEGINHVKTNNMTILIITHYQRILNYVKPDRVIIMMNGKVVQEGRADVIHRLEKEGYEWLEAKNT
jgi:Fe-S cluster assembly ATP-binding protein